MYVNVQILGSDGVIKGKKYAYETDMELQVGDMVVADMGGNDKVLCVAEIDVEIGEVDYEIKQVKRLATEEDMPTGSSIDMRFTEEQLPVISINYEELEKALSEMLAKYKNIVVTEATLAGCKATQRELAGMRNKIDRGRIDKVKELSVPIKAFEAQCKDLIALIEAVEKPIKEGIELFDDKKRATKRKDAEKLIAETVTKMGLNEKFAKQLTVVDKYCNLTATKSSVQDDLMARAAALLSEQNREQDILDIITSTVEGENARLKTPMNPDDFTKLINSGLPAKDVIAQIKARADNIFEAENPKEEVKEVVEEPVKVLEVKAPVKEAPKYYAIYKVEGTEQELLSLSAFLRNGNLKYEVKEQGRL